MKYLIITYRTRTSLYEFSSLLRRHNIPHSIINTPHAISGGCSLSIKLPFAYLNIINSLLNQTSNRNLLGIFVANQTNTFEQFNRIM